MSGSGEVAADEDPGVASPENNEDTDVLNNSDAETEPAMIEEEEMPTYLSLTSSSRPDESKADLEVHQQAEDTSRTDEGKGNRADSPYANDDQAGRTVYVVSSGEESDRAYDDEDYESDDMELGEEEEEEEDDDEDDSRHGINDDEEDSDGDIEPEQFERSSDDFLLRYDTSLERHHKARSRSLQDLTNSRGNLSRFVGKRRSVDIMGHSDDEEISAPPIESLRDPLGDVKKPVRSSRYANVPSKVKMYIQSIKEESRRSAESKNLENPLHRNFNESRGGNSEVSCTRINPANKMMKGYAQNVIDAIIEEQDNKNMPDVTYSGRRLGENGLETDPLLVPETKQSSDKDVELETELNPDDQINNAHNIGRSTKCNGIIMRKPPNHSEKVVEHMETCETNGQEESDGILNLRTVTYEEYANGDPASTNKAKDDEKLPSAADKQNGLVEEEEILMEEEEIVGMTETVGVPISLKVESVKVSVSTPAVAQVVRKTTEVLKSAGHEMAATNRENADVAMLWAMLNQKAAQFNEKTAQYDGIRDAFQKTLAENISLKRELDEMKKALEHCRTEHKPRETSVAAVQTDNVTESEEMKISPDASKISNNDLKPPGPKIFSSSIASCMSSIEQQWSDSNCSPAISINPPNMDHALNSDDSLTLPERTPRREPRPLSHSFITSSRILQTLANITQGRTKTASPLANSARTVDPRLEAEQGQSNPETDSPLASGNDASGTRARKRKASDMLGFSGYAEPFKMPQTSDVPRKKINSDFHTDGVYKSSRDQLRTGNLKEPTPGRSKDTENGDRRTDDDFETTGATEVPENVKCFVYQEEADSKERSFLIQAEESSKSSDIGHKGGTARECGPYLLGNVEIRMSEANGTINIWGKEINQESEYIDVEDEDQEEKEEEEEEELEVEAMDESDPVEKCSHSRRASLDGLKTPRAKCGNGASPFVCSTNKKLKSSSQGVRSSIGKYFRPALSNLARLNAVMSEGAAGRYASSPTLDNRTKNCEQCDPHTKQRPEWPSYDHLTNPRHKQHSCCRPEVEVMEKECDCARDRGTLDEDAILQAMTNILSSHNRCTAVSHNSLNKRSCPNHPSEDNCKHQSPHHQRQSLDEVRHEADCHHAKKRCSSCAVDLPPCNARLTPGKSGCCDNRSRSHSHVSSCDEDDHLLLHNGHSETPEIKRRRLSGKKVRGILTDLLRGCGGCKNDSGTSFLAKGSASSPHSVPTVRVTPCTPQRPSCSKSSAACTSHAKHPEPRNCNNDKCCSTGSRRAEMAAEIESTLELLTVEMERLRSRSDTFRGMLNLLTADTD